jgi:UDP-N-acetylmuramyl pentapeptide synthase
VAADLEYLSVFSGKKAVVMPCLIELGAVSAQVHERIGAQIAKVCDLAIITTKDRFEDIKRGAGIGGMSADKIILCDNPKEMFSRLTTFLSAGDAVLLEGRVPGQLITLLHAK